MEIIIESIVFNEDGSIAVHWHDSTCLTFGDLQGLIDYSSIVLSTDAIKRIILGKLLVDNNIAPTNTPKKYTLIMTGEPVLKIQDV